MNRAVKDISEYNSFTSCRNWKLCSDQSRGFSEEGRTRLYSSWELHSSRGLWCSPTIPHSSCVVQGKSVKKPVHLPSVSTIFLKFGVHDSRPSFSFTKLLSPRSSFCVDYVKDYVLPKLNHGYLKLDTPSWLVLILSAEEVWFSVEVCVQYLSHSYGWFPVFLSELGLPPLVSLLIVLISLFGLPISALHCSDSSQPSAFSVLVFWHLYFFKPTLPVLLFKSITSTPSVWPLFPHAFEFDISFLLLKACPRDTGSVGPVQCWAKLMLNWVIKSDCFLNSLGWSSACTIRSPAGIKSAQFSSIFGDLSCVWFSVGSMFTVSF